MKIINESEKNSKAKLGVARNIFRHHLTTLILVLIVLIAAMAVVTKGVFLGRGTAVNVLFESSIRGMATIGQALVILSGGIDLSVGGIGLLASIVGSTSMTEAPYLNIIGYPIPIASGVLLMLLVGAGIGILNGTLVSRISMPPLIVTLGMWQVCKGIGVLVGGARSITFLPEGLSFLGQGRISGIPVPIIVFVILAVLIYIMLNYSTLGRRIYAIGGSPTSAWLSGINVKRTQLIVYTLSGLFAGMAGVASTARTMQVSMLTLSGLELDSIAAVAIGGVSVMGGRGNLIGVVVGIVILGVLGTGMTVMGLGPAYQGVILGVVILIAISIDAIRQRR